MCYIKALLGVLYIIGLSGTIVGLGTANLIIILSALALTVSCAIGACTAERLEETQNVESMRKLPKQKIQKGL